MRFRIIAILSILAIPIPTALLLSRLNAKAKASDAAPQEIARPDGTVSDALETVRLDAVPPDQAVRRPQSIVPRAQWHVTIPKSVPNGRFTLRGNLEINPDALRQTERIAISVLVRDGISGVILDTASHATLVAVPTERYEHVVNQKFDLPSGVYRITFLAAHENVEVRQPDGSVGPAVYAQRTGTVRVP